MHDRFAEHRKAERAFAVRAAEFGFITFISVAIRGAVMVVRGHLDCIDVSNSIMLVTRDITHPPTSALVVIWAPATRRDDFFSAKQPNDRWW